MAGRIKNVLNYKKPAFWLIIVVVIVTVAVSIGLLSNPKGDVLTQKEAQRIVEEEYPSPFDVEAIDEQIVYDNINCYIFEIRNPLISVMPGNEELHVVATVGVVKETGAILTYDTTRGKWYAFTGLSENDPLTEETTTFKTTETDLLEIGRIAFDEYMAPLTSDNTPDSDRIASCQLNDISVLAGDIEEFCVALNYDFTTDNDSYVNPGRGAKG